MGRRRAYCIEPLLSSFAVRVDTNARALSSLTLSPTLAPRGACSLSLSLRLSLPPSLSLFLSFSLSLSFFFSLAFSLSLSFFLSLFLSLSLPRLPRYAGDIKTYPPQGFVTFVMKMPQENVAGLINFLEKDKTSNSSYIDWRTRSLTTKVVVVAPRSDTETHAGGGFTKEDAAVFGTFVVEFTAQGAVKATYMLRSVPLGGKDPAMDWSFSLAFLALAVLELVFVIQLIACTSAERLKSRKRLLEREKAFRAKILTEATELIRHVRHASLPLPRKGVASTAASLGFEPHAYYCHQLSVTPSLPRCLSSFSSLSLSLSLSLFLALSRSRPPPLYPCAAPRNDCAFQR